MNDSVREELQSKITPVLQRASERRIAATAPAVATATAMPRPEPVVPASAETIGQKPVAGHRITTELHAPKTSPTLVEFQPKQTAVPDWRLHLQNSVRQRRGGAAQAAGVQTDVAEPQQARLVTQGANALKVEPLAEVKPEPSASIADPRVANALKRIDHSRKTFAPTQAPLKQPTPSGKSQPGVSTRDYPFNVVSRNAEPAVPRPAERKPLISPSPKLIPTFKIEKRAYDTNKLPRLSQPEDRIEEQEADELVTLQPTAGVHEEPVSDLVVVCDEMEQTDQSFTDHDIEEESPEVIDDLAPISMRFNAGLFDMIIGAFASLLLLSPLVLMGGDWFTMSGLLAFSAAWAIVMFVYLTASIGMYGRTIGMRIFSLELIDVEANEYPTFHQAAVNSAVYLLTLPVAGIGFLPAFLNEEQRAAHDLAAGTIVVTEV